MTWSADLTTAEPMGAEKGLSITEPQYGVALNTGEDFEKPPGSPAGLSATAQQELDVWSPVETAQRHGFSSKSSPGRPRVTLDPRFERFLIRFLHYTSLPFERIATAVEARGGPK